MGILVDFTRWFIVDVALFLLFLFLFFQGLSVELDSLLLTHTAYFRLKIIDSDFVISLIVKKQSHLRPDSIRIDKNEPFFPLWHSPFSQKDNCRYQMSVI